MKYNKRCECCGHQITAYEHYLNSMLVQALQQLVEQYQKNGTAVHLQKDLDLTKSQYNNFQKLQYFGLARRTEDGWFPTSLGVQFVIGEVGVFDRVATFGKEILSNDHIVWQTSTKRPRLIHISEVKNYYWKGRVEYQNEKSN